MQTIDLCLVLKRFFFGLCCLTVLNETTAEENQTTSMCGLQPIYRSTVADLRLTIVANECTSSSLSKTVVFTSAWICERLNLLDVFGGELRFGVNVYHVCNADDMIDPVVDIVRKPEGYGLGIISWKPVPTKIRALANALEVPLTEVPKQFKALVITSVGLVTALGWNENLTVITDHSDVMHLFYHESRKEWICVKDIRTFRDIDTIDYNNPVVMFGNGDKLNAIFNNITQMPSVIKIIVVPLDGAQVEGLPNGAYIIQPLYADIQQNLTKTPKIIPSPILLDIAIPIINIAKNITRVLAHCNSTQNITCLQKKSKHLERPFTSYQEVLTFLKIEPLTDRFIYNIFKVEHLDLSSQKIHTNETYDVSIVQSFIKIGIYNVFNYTLILDGIQLEDINESNPNTCFQNHKLCVGQCMNYQRPFSTLDDDHLIYNIVLKQDPWVLAVLAIASLGVLFCTAILIFIFVRLCKKDIFEGNPVLSVLLLLTLTVMYASVVPFALEVTSETELRSTLSNYLCLIRSLAVTMSYSCAFSLLLSRCVMLATVAYEAGFMSHITGHVQSLLCLFMIAVQGALSLQSIENCQDLFTGTSFLYVLSYDVLLLGLLLCSCPFVYRSQRNYKEGGYFAIAIMLVCIFWMAWLTAFVVVQDCWKMAVVCSGLLGTASSILGAVFIPRTYLMTSAVVRDNIASALPSLHMASSTSVLDLNYTNAQHVYDCVNIATINAVGMTHHQQTLPSPTVPAQCNPNFYSDEPGLEETAERYVTSHPCDSPDKVTRF